MAPVALGLESHANDHTKSHPNGHTNGHPNGFAPSNGSKARAHTAAGVINSVASLKLGPNATTANDGREVPYSPQSTSSDLGLSPSPGKLRSVFRDAANSVWVITSAWENQPVGFTAISVNCVSVDPPMISFNIGRSSSSLNALSRSLRFAAHLLDHGAGDTARRFAGTTAKRFETPSTWGWDSHGLPRLEGGVTLARLSGSILSLSAAGDNLIAICRVEDTERRAGEPLVHHQGTYRSLVLPEQGRRRDRRIFLNAFDMCCVGHQSPGLWAHPSDRSETYKDLEYWTSLARTLEAGGFDCLFLADVLGTYDVYAGSRDAAVRSAAQVPVNDPVIPISAMAAVTKTLGFGVTVSLTYELPYAFARRMSTLDHLTKGRVAWNIVTSYLQSAAVNLGLDTQIGHDERYAIADEFVEVCYKLWEGSWEDGAVIKDRKKGVFADPAKVHDIAHAGKYFTVPGAHLCEPSPQRTPFIFQAGASPRGQAFGARHAEAVFISGPTRGYLKKTAANIRAAASAAGRDPYDVKIFCVMTVIAAETDAAAHAKLADLKRYASIEGALALYGGWAGVDLSTLDPDQPLEYVANDAVQSVNLMWKKSSGIEEQWTPRKMAEKIGIGGRGPLVVGSGVTVADELERWVDETDVDGFNLAYAVTPGTFEDFITHVVPVLRARGRLPPLSQVGETPLTLRERMGGKSAHVDRTHAAYQYKVSKKNSLSGL